MLKGVYGDDDSQITANKQNLATMATLAFRIAHHVPLTGEAAKTNANPELDAGTTLNEEEQKAQALSEAVVFVLTSLGELLVLDAPDEVQTAPRTVEAVSVGVPPAGSSKDPVKPAPPAPPPSPAPRGPAPKLEIRVFHYVAAEEHHDYRSTAELQVPSGTGSASLANPRSPPRVPPRGPVPKPMPPPQGPRPAPRASSLDDTESSTAHAGDAGGAGPADLPGNPRVPPRNPHRRSDLPVQPSSPAAPSTPTPPPRPRPQPRNQASVANDDDGESTGGVELGADVEAIDKDPVSLPRPRPPRRRLVHLHPSLSLSPRTEGA
ncbi:hypothetical protein MN608_05708 [Microdochium nivale]|nr:hypothetical protein MN608_05708 [Microdochium nivale]